ncbi:DNA polymerase III subunit gamma/tau [Idiomarina seosinensis]|uniref:DNA polymerase III subunit gamma/tau n=1 Tax=Idiomarina seosinensis TaxID=281739 RepID=A0A432ZJF8_9GAMM|nr:DNA polymerase III subunit gamma/tau [Idiomarina seosinensis]RUO78053.1 DNA polymerase III subunit gamma/tau [Idiomarina seosinensis]
MSYQVLARKWRPSQFSQVVGQTHVLKPLQHALDSNRLHHAYLFTGTRGVGKTTIARLLAKALNCVEGVSSAPCGKCDTCQAIEQGRFVDLLEIDAASRTKVEDTRELLDNVQYRPTHGRYKVYLIDEVHMLSRHSFNALLKTLEEPPEHVKFLLATTDPQKLPVTVISRCLQFNLRALTTDLIAGQLQHVLEEEHVTANSEALTMLARAARGSMRDGLSLTDQAIAQGDGAVNLESVQQMLGNVPKADIAALLNAVADGSSNQVFTLLEQMAAVVPDMGAVLTELQALLHRLALVQQLPELATAEEQQDNIKQLLRKLPAEVIQLYYRLVIEGRKEQPYAVDERAGVEMTLLRLLAFEPISNNSAEQVTEQPSEPVPALNEPVSDNVAADVVAESLEQEPPLAEPPDYHQADEPEPAPESVTEPSSADISDLLKMREQLVSGDAKPTTANTVADQKKNAEVAPKSESEAIPQSFDGELPELNPNIRLAEEVDEWSAMIAAMDVSGLARQLLLNSNLHKVADQNWQVRVAPAQQSLLSEATEQAVTEALRQTLSQQGKFEFTVEEPQQPTPLMIQQHINSYRHQLAVEWLQQDPGANELQQRFAAQLNESTIKAV